MNNFVLAYHVPKFINKNVMNAYYPYLVENQYPVSNLLCERNIYKLSMMPNSQKAIIMEKVKAWLEYMIENDFLTIDELTNQIMSILHLSWPDVISFIKFDYFVGIHFNYFFCYYYFTGHIKMFINLLQ